MTVQFILLTRDYIVIGYIFNVNARCLSRVRDRAFMYKRKILQRAGKTGNLCRLINARRRFLGDFSASRKPYLSTSRQIAAAIHLCLSLRKYTSINIKTHSLQIMRLAHINIDKCTDIKYSLKAIY